MDSEKQSTSWLDRPVFQAFPQLTIETTLAALIIILTLFSRFYMLGARVMSHDEVNHMVPSYDFFQGKGYRYDPVTHGPLQFHLIAASFFLLGDSDFAARVPVAVLNTVTVVIVLFFFRRYLSRIGALIAGFMFLISPYILFYSRYARNEIFIVLWGVGLLWSILRYLETGKSTYIYTFTLFSAFHFIDKATSYIFAAEILVFLGFFFVERITRRSWDDSANLRKFIIMIVLAVVLGGAVLGLALTTKQSAADAAAATPPPATLMMQISKIGIPVLLVLTLASGGAGMYFLVKGLGWKNIRQERAFDLLVLQLTLVLPLLAAIFVKMAGLDPKDYSSTGVLRSVGFIIPLAAAAIAAGVWWNRRLWINNAVIFFSIFVVFYTTFFTNPGGLITGWMGALGYWADQQAVNRGSQPWYYYVLVQIPMYEFLPAVGALLAVWIGLRKRLWLAKAGLPFERNQEPGSAWPEEETKSQDTNSAAAISTADAETGGVTLPAVISADQPPADEQSEVHPQPAAALDLRPVPTLPLLLFWSLLSLVSFSIAGEKMPWLTTHITMPMILCSGWAFGYLFETARWKEMWKNRLVVVLLLGVVFLVALGESFASVIGANLPFQGKELAQLQATSTFLFALVALAVSGAGLYYFGKSWRLAEILRVAALIVFTMLAVLTARAAIRASYVTYDTALEYLVYAHAARGPKDALAIMEEISQRVTGGKDLSIAYDNDGLYPYWWYLRDYPNHRWYTDKPTRDLRDSPLIIVSEANYSKIEPIVAQGYYKIDYVRLWWPNQDYWDLNWPRISGALSDPKIRAGIWDIWLNRDYAAYSAATNHTDLTLATWQPSNRMRLYIRKDVAALVWNFGVAPVSEPTFVDPYAKNVQKINADLVVGTLGSEPGKFNAPRGIAVAPDGSLYVADSRNNRVQHFASDGKLLQTWGTAGDISKGESPGGAFNEPWGIAVSQDGSVFVADTWNHRIQKFTADGKFVKMWGVFGQGDTPESFYGPRGLAIDSNQRLYVTDTGNKRVVVFDLDGKFVTQFGSEGMDAGQFDEPVGIAVDKAGIVYVADTWNQRIQAFSPNQIEGQPLSFTHLLSWDVSAWFGKSLDNKPYIAVDTYQHVFIADPDGYRVIEFSSISHRTCLASRTDGM